MTVSQSFTPNQSIFGPAFTASGIISNQNNLNISAAGSSAARVIFPYAGKVVGLVRDQGATSISIGTLSVKLRRSGSTISTTNYSSAARSYSLFSAITFNAGQDLSFQYSTDTDYIGSGTLVIIPVIIFDY